MKISFVQYTINDGSMWFQQTVRQISITHARFCI